MSDDPICEQNLKGYQGIGMKLNIPGKGGDLNLVIVADNLKQLAIVKRKFCKEDLIEANCHPAIVISPKALKVTKPK